MTTTWSATNICSNCSLSGGDLVASDITGSVNDTGRSDATISGTDREYFEVGATALHLSGGNYGVGLVTSAWSFINNRYLGQLTGSLGYYQDGTVFLDGSQLSTMTGYSQGAVIGVAVDRGAGKVWFTLDGSNWNPGLGGSQNPAVGSQAGGISIPSGTLYPAYNISGTGSVASSVTANFGATTPAYTKPTGFSTFDGSAVLSPVTWDQDAHARSTHNTVVFNVATMSGDPNVDSDNLGFCGRATVAITGKRYWESIVDRRGTGESGVGIIGTGACPPWPNEDNENLLGQNGGVSYVCDGGVWVEGVLRATYAAFPDGANVGLAVDATNHLLWVRVDGGNWNNDSGANPATGTGGFDYSGYNVTGDIYPGYQVYWGDLINGPDSTSKDGPSTCEGIFEASHFKYTPPSGFSAIT